MKKTYIEPRTSVIVVNAKTSLLSASDPQSQTLSIDGDNISNGEQVGSRRIGGLWDEED